MDVPTWSAKIAICDRSLFGYFKSLIETLPFLPRNILVPTGKGLVVCVSGSVHREQTVALRRSFLPLLSGSK
jgi:hypothetical protein